MTRRLVRRSRETHEKLRARLAQRAAEGRRPGVCAGSINSGTRGAEELLELVERRQVVDRDRLHAAVDPLDEAREDVPRADLDIGAHALAEQLLRGLGEADRRRELLDEERAH